MSSTPSNSNTASFAATAITPGVPNLVDDNFTNAIAAAMAGGPALQSYFDASNATSSFWTYIANAVAEGYNPFEMGLTTDNQLVLMANDGNTSFRLSYFYNDDQSASPRDGDEPMIVGTGQMQIGDSTTNLSKWASFGLSIVELPAGLYLTKKLFAGLLKPLFKNAATLLKTNAQKIYAKCTSNETVYAQEEAEDSINEEDSLLEDTGDEVAETGVEYVAVEWSASVLQIAGLGILAAVPIIAMQLGHPMYATVTVLNQTTIDFTWAITCQDSGEASALPGTSTTVDYDLPAIGLYTDQWGDKTLQPCSYQATFQFINSNDYGSIGLVLELNPADGTTPAQIVVSIPWAGTNTIWLGASTDEPQTIYDTYSAANNQITMSYSFDTFQVTLAITALSGKNDAGQYAYGVMANIEPLSSAS